MTTMDSDSASQDSDEGRRFRFEATRKDSAALVDTMRGTRSPKKKSKHKSSRYESSRHYHRERKERSKHESDRKGDDLKHSTKHSKHESRNSRQEDGKNSSKDHRDGRDAFVGFTVNDRDFRNSSGGDEKEKSRDSKRQSDRDRSIHLAQRSRERSYERNVHHEEQTSSDKHRSRYHERHGHHSRDRSHQSSRVKSSNGDHRSRENHGRHDSSRKTSMKEDRSQNLKDYSSPKNVERERSHSEARSCENPKKDLSVNAQDCKDLDLSQFDVLSEIDENTSDDRDYESRVSSPRETKLHDSRDRLESCATKEARENGEDANKSKREELSKVKKRNYDPVSSSRSNPNAISDSSLSSAPPATILIVRDTSTSSKKEKLGKTITCDTSEFSGLEEKKCSDAFSNETQLEKDAEQTESVYGPPLPPRFVSNISDSDEKTSPYTLDENKIGNEVVDESPKSVCFIGPCRPPELSNLQNEEQEEAKDTNTFATEADVFGPALPPHLLQRQRDNDSRDSRVIGPVLPDAVKLCNESSVTLSDSDEDCAIGPLPVDHPALRNSRVQEKLDLRAQKIRNEGYLEEVDIGSKREEWMTELPSVQAANLGLGPRKFKVREGPDMSDRSCWTDTPAQKAQKQKDLEIKKLNNVSEPDKEYVEEFCKKDTGKSKKREKSLLEMHQSKIAKKKRKKEKEAERTGISTRRPFDRDIDLQVTRLDQAQKKTIVMKAQLLDDRFSRGQI